MKIKELIEKLKIGNLDAQEAEFCIHTLLNDDVSLEQKSALLNLLDGLTSNVVEVQNFAEFILNNCIVPFSYDQPLMDVCGTGGDGNNSINISTLTAIILASTGTKICKHGNYGVTSISGSSGILEFLGYKFKFTEKELKQELDKFNITFLHAPLFHPILKSVGSLRKNLGTKSIFNVLGPMVNPMQPAFRFTGVSSLQVARSYHFIYQSKGLNYSIIHSLDGNDEVTLTAKVKVFSNEGEKIFHPKDLSNANVIFKDIEVYSMSDAANKFMEVLKCTASINMIETVLSNTALALMVRDSNLDYYTSKSICREALESGKALKTLNNLIN